MTDLRDRIVDALYEPPVTMDGTLAELAHTVATRRARERANAVMPIVDDLATDLQHAERENRRLVEELKRLKGET